VGPFFELATIELRKTHNKNVTKDGTFVNLVLSSTEYVKLMACRTDI
jgi:hypothetical protein